MHKKTIIWECIKMAWQQIIGNKKRSFLTSLGIIIGIASVIALITIVQGISGAMMGQFDSLGSGTLTLSITGSVLKSSLKDDDLDTICSVSGVKGYSPNISGTTTVVKDGEVYDDVAITGTNDMYFEINDDILLQGRPLKAIDNSAHLYICLVNESLAKDVFGSIEKAVGQEIILNGRRYSVIGVTEDDDSSIASAFSSSDSDYGVILPYKNAMRILGVGNLTSISIYVDEDADAATVRDNLDIVLDQMFNYIDDTYTLSSLDSLLEALETIETMLTAMLAGIASISLLVGGIGIMNMMLVSVSERTKEIGLRKALGAEPGQIQLQFVIESIMLSLIGGVVGIIVGLLIAVIAGIVIGITITPSVFAIVLGAGFASVVGIGFGWGPSKKASGLSPIDALRTE